MSGGQPSDASERPKKDGRGRIALNRRGNAQSALPFEEKGALIFATGLRHVYDRTIDIR